MLKKLEDFFEIFVAFSEYLNFNTTTGCGISKSGIQNRIELYEKVNHLKEDGEPTNFGPNFSKQSFSNLT